MSGSTCYCDSPTMLLIFGGCPAHSAERSSSHADCDGYGWEWDYTKQFCVLAATVRCSQCGAVLFDHLFDGEKNRLRWHNKLERSRHGAAVEAVLGKP